MERELIKYQRREISHRLATLRYGSGLPPTGFTVVIQRAGELSLGENSRFELSQWLEAQVIVEGDLSGGRSEWCSMIQIRFDDEAAALRELDLGRDPLFEMFNRGSAAAQGIQSQCPALGSLYEKLALRQAADLGAGAEDGSARGGKRL